MAKTKITKREERSPRPYRGHRRERRDSGVQGSTMPLSSDDLTSRHLARVVESSDDAIISKDLNSTITSWNRAAERMFGYTAAEAVGRSIRMIIPKDRQFEEDDVLGHIRQGEAVSHFETMREHKDGTQLPISLTVS